PRIDDYGPAADQLICFKRRPGESAIDALEDAIVVRGVKDIRILRINDEAAYRYGDGPGIRRRPRPSFINAPEYSSVAECRQQGVRVFRIDDDVSNRDGYSDRARPRPFVEFGVKCCELKNCYQDNFEQSFAAQHCNHQGLVEYAAEHVKL